jgi:hypothetical protein
MNFEITSNGLSNKGDPLKSIILILISALLGLYLFLANPWLKTDLYADSYS